jgi:hypothetical protein
VSDLTPEAKELVHQARSAFRPSDADRERVFQALLPQIGAGAALGATPSLLERLRQASWLKVSGAVVGLGAAGGLFLAFGPADEPKPAAPATTSPIAANAETPRPDMATIPTPVAPPVLAPPEGKPEARVQQPVTRADRLAAEVAILSRAGTELHNGRAAAALQTLEEHQRKFPSGLLAQERASARIQALCALGRVKEADAELTRLSRLSPQSPHEARAREACGSALKKKP